MSQAQQQGTQPGQQPAMDPTQAMAAASQSNQPQVPPQPNQANMQDDGGVEAESQRMEAILKAAITSKNLVGTWDDENAKQKERLDKMSEVVSAGYKLDLQSCNGWYTNNREWLKLALLMRESKVYPWVGAANIKYPLLATAAMQFSARAYPTLVPADNQIVKGRVIGYDPDGTRTDRADRISKHMSYQIMYKIDNWEEDMDRLLNLVSIVGVVFKKTYRDADNKICSKLVYPENLIVNYGCTSLAHSYRKTEVLYYTNKDYIERVRGGYFRDIGDLGIAKVDTEIPEYDKPSAMGIEKQMKPDETTPHIFLSQHTFYDVDDDGYPEPVEIIWHKETGKVVRVVARFSLDGVKMDDKGKKVVSIEPIEYFTDFPFLPNPDGSLYGVGFGVLLGPINEAVNTLINQLVDSGTLNNMQSGFIGKGLRIQMKESKFVPGEWKAVNATGDDLKKSIFPLPTKEPSEVLFQLMNVLIQSGNQLASVAEIFVGKMPGQNTPATTTQETVDQAMKVFTAIYKRIYRALLKEFQKIYELLRLTPSIVDEEARILNIQLTASDYDGPADDIIPAADPTGASSATQMQKISQIGQQLLPLGVLNPQEYASRILKYADINEPEKLIAPPQPPQPDPKVQTEQMKQQTMQMKAGIDQQKGQQDIQMKQQEYELKRQMAELEAQIKQLEMSYKAQDLKMDLAGKQQEHQLEMQIQQDQARATQIQTQLDLRTQAQLGQQKVQQNAQMGKQKLDQGAASHKQKMRQMNEQRNQQGRNAGVAASSGHKGNGSGHKGAGNRKKAAAR